MSQVYTLSVKTVYQYNYFYMLTYSQCLPVAYMLTLVNQLSPPWLVISQLLSLLSELVI